MTQPELFLNFLSLDYKSAKNLYEEIPLQSALKDPMIKKLLTVAIISDSVRNVEDALEGRDGDFQCIALEAAREAKGIEVLYWILRNHRVFSTPEELSLLFRVAASSENGAARFLWDNYNFEVNFDCLIELVSGTDLSLFVEVLKNVCPTERQMITLLRDVVNMDNLLVFKHLFSDPKNVELLKKSLDGIVLKDSPRIFAYMNDEIGRVPLAPARKKTPIIDFTDTLFYAIEHGEDDCVETIISTMDAGSSRRALEQIIISHVNPDIKTLEAIISKTEMSQDEMNRMVKSALHNPNLAKAFINKGYKVSEGAITKAIECVCIETVKLFMDEVKINISDSKWWHTYTSSPIRSALFIRNGIVPPRYILEREVEFSSKRGGWPVDDAIRLIKETLDDTPEVPRIPLFDNRTFVILSD